MSKEEKLLWEAILPRYRSGRAVAILHQSINLFYFESATVTNKVDRLSLLGEWKEAFC